MAAEREYEQWRVGLVFGLLWTC